ncbi:ATP-binding protein [Marmoricola sp. OAE513]|uniref:ATP-binding protein n=1 Tax=Marmoricola sp. OAE513 TaxID=2817894 RepID=UPI001AEAAE44
MRATFPADLRAPAQARSFVATQLEGIGDDETLGEDLVLIVSELVTNAVRAGAARIDVQLSTTSDRIDLQVTDDAEGWPTPRPSLPGDTGGRGLAIVEQLADTWGTQKRNPGKTVTATWFRDTRSH